MIRQRDDDVRTGLGGQPHQGHERFGGAGHNLDGLDGDTLHLSDRLTQTVGAGGSLKMSWVEEAMARFVVGEGEDVVYRPDRSVLAARLNSMWCSYWSSQASSRKGLSCMRAPRREWLVLVIDSASGPTVTVFRQSDAPACRVVNTAPPLAKNI